MFLLIVTGFGLIGFFCFILFNKGKRSGIRGYEKIRNKLTVREPEPEPEEEDDIEPIRGFSLGKLIGGFVVILVGLTLLPTVKDVVARSETQIAMNTMNVTSSVPMTTSKVLGLVPIVFAIAIGFTGIFLAFNNFKG